MTTAPVFVVGAGSVGTALAGALRAAGVEVVGMWGRRQQSVEPMAAAVGVTGHWGAPPRSMATAHTIIVAVRDEAIPDVARRLRDASVLQASQTLLHTSGAVAAAVAFADVALDVGAVGLLHPLTAIDDGIVGSQRLAGSTFGIEGDPRARQSAKSLVMAMGGTALELDGSNLAAYHAAAAMVSNYLASLIDMGAELMEGAGVPRGQAVVALAGLARGTAENVGARGLPAGLTGPIRRGDRSTVESHLAALADRPDVLRIYRALARYTAEMARPVADSQRLDAVLELVGPSDD